MWVMNTERDGPDIAVRIGALQIANIHLVRDAKRWKAHVRFMDGCVDSCDCEGVGQALHIIHHHLNSPPKEQT